MNDKYNYGSFSVSASGIAATYTQEFQRVLDRLEEDDAVAAFLEQANATDPATALYGLSGLKLLKSDDYQRAREQVLTQGGTIYLGKGGCCFRAASVSDAVSYLESALV